MKISELLKAQGPLKTLTEKNYNGYEVLRKLVRLRKAVDEEVDFYVEQEQKAVQKYAEKDGKGQPVILDGGRIKLKDIEAKKTFDEEISQLRNMEIESIVKVVIKEGDFRSVDDFPTPAEMLALECLIDFE